jgi:hypothetical protein
MVSMWAMLSRSWKQSARKAEDNLRELMVGDSQGEKRNQVLNHPEERRYKSERQRLCAGGERVVVGTIGLAWAWGGREGGGQMVFGTKQLLKDVALRVEGSNL